MQNKTYTSRYLSLLFYGFLIPYASHFLISIRENESLLVLFRNKYYWIALAYTLLLSYAFALAIKIMSGHLDKNPKLVAHDVLRVVWQFMLGAVLPLVLIIGLTTVYFDYFDESIIERGYFVHELPLIVLYLAVVNGFYLLLYLNEKAATLHESYLQQRELLTKNGSILVHYRGEQVPINLAEIAMINQVELVNWLITNTGESYILNLSLKEAAKLLGTYDFFQINRKQIVGKATVKKVANGTFGKLELTLAISCTQAVVVSKDRAKNFKKWLAGRAN